MTAIEHDQDVVVFRQLYAAYVVHISCVCSTLGVNGREKVHRYHALGIVEVLAAERIDLLATVCFTNIV